MTRDQFLTEMMGECWHEIPEIYAPGNGKTIHVLLNNRRREAMTDISQIGIMLFGCSAIWLVGRKESWRKWGYALGLCSQPFWFWTAYTNEQWGIFILSFWYTYSWAQGVWNFIVKE